MKKEGAEEGGVYVKCEKDDEEVVVNMVGYRSGKRSAIVEKDGKLLRLKGCGNLGQGFPLQNMAYPPEQLEIRGV